MVDTYIYVSIIQMYCMVYMWHLNLNTYCILYILTLINSA